MHKSVHFTNLFFEKKTRPKQVPSLTVIIKFDRTFQESFGFNYSLQIDLKQELILLCCIQMEKFIQI